MFTRKSHALTFVIGIVAIAVFVADERGAVGSVTAGAERDREIAAANAASAPPPGQAQTAAEAPAWEDEPEAGDPPDLAEGMEPMPDLTGEDVHDPMSEALDPVPFEDDGW